MENQTEQKQPSREEIIKWYKDEIEMATLRAELAKLQRDAAMSEAERINAIAAIAQMTQQPQEEEEGKPEGKPEAKTRTLKRDAPLDEVH